MRDAGSKNILDSVLPSGLNFPVRPAASTSAFCNLRKDRFEDAAPHQEEWMTQADALKTWARVAGKNA